MYANIETITGDCDGRHYHEAVCTMNESEKNDPCGDLDFFDRVLSYTVNTVAEYGTLTIARIDGLPRFVWSEDTEEGYKQVTAEFYKY